MFCKMLCYVLCDFSIVISYENTDNFLIFRRRITHFNSNKNSQLGIIKVYTTNEMRTIFKINVTSSILRLV